MPRRLSRAERTRRRDAWGVVLMVAALTLGVGILLAWRYTSASRVGADYCSESGPSELLAILVDSTDDLTEAQLLDVRNRIVSGIQNARTGTGVQIWRVMAHSNRLPEPVGRVLCRPERNPNPLYQGARMLKEQYQAFEREALTQVDESLRSGSQAQSPILEAIQAVSLKMFNAPGYASVSTRRLWIVSDLRQNTESLSFLRDTPDFERFKRDAVYERTRSDLSRVTVKVLYLSRPSGGIRALVEFWQQTIADFGGVLEEVERIAG